MEPQTTNPGYGDDRTPTPEEAEARRLSNRVSELLFEKRTLEDQLKEQACETSFLRGRVVDLEKERGVIADRLGLSWPDGRVSFVESVMALIRQKEETLANERLQRHALQSRMNR
jgi:hypothetical protein